MFPAATSVNSSLNTVLLKIRLKYLGYITVQLVNNISLWSLNRLSGPIKNRHAAQYERYLHHRCRPSACAHEADLFLKMNKLAKCEANLFCV